MTIDRRNIFLWDTLNAGKYSPLFNPKQCDYSEEEEVYIINKVDGLDEILSIKLKNEYGICYKLIPKDNNDFMENHQIAIEQNFKSHIYVTPDLLSKILLKKKKLKDVWIMTFKERWDILYSKMYGPY